MLSTFADVLDPFPSVEVGKSLLASSFYHISTTPALSALLSLRPLSPDGASLVTGIFFVFSRLASMARAAVAARNRKSQNKKKTQAKAKGE